MFCLFLVYMNTPTMTSQPKLAKGTSEEHANASWRPINANAAALAPAVHTWRHRQTYQVRALIGCCHHRVPVSAALTIRIDTVSLPGVSVIYQLQGKLTQGFPGNAFMWLVSSGADMRFVLRVRLLGLGECRGSRAAACRRWVAVKPDQATFASTLRGRLVFLKPVSAHTHTHTHTFRPALPQLARLLLTCTSQVSTLLPPPSTCICLVLSDERGAATSQPVVTTKDNLRAVKGNYCL